MPSPENSDIRNLPGYGVIFTEEQARLALAIAEAFVLKNVIGGGGTGSSITQQEVTDAIEDSSKVANIETNTGNTSESTAIISDNSTNIADVLSNLTYDNPLSFDGSNSASSLQTISYPLIVGENVTELIPVVCGEVGEARGRIYVNNNSKIIIDDGADIASLPYTINKSIGFAANYIVLLVRFGADSVARNFNITVKTSFAGSVAEAITINNTTQPCTPIFIPRQYFDFVQIILNSSTEAISPVISFSVGNISHRGLFKYVKENASTISYTYLDQGSADERISTISYEFNKWKVTDSHTYTGTSGGYSISNVSSTISYIT